MMTFTLPPDHLEVTFKRKIFAPSSHKVLKKKKEKEVLPPLTSFGIWTSIGKIYAIFWRFVFKFRAVYYFRKKLGKSQL